MEKLIFGDNQFFGVNHYSEEKSEQQLKRFDSVEKIVDVLRIAYETGLKGFMLHSHPLAQQICDVIRSDQQYWKDLVIYPAIPHPVKYMNKVGEMGIYRTVLDLLKEGKNMSSTLGSFFKGGLGLMTKNPITLGKAAIELEMQPYHGLNVGAVFLHNIAVDLLLGFGINSPYPQIEEFINNKYNAELGYITLNMPLLVDSLSRVGITKPLIMSSFNRIGYYMNPDQKTCEKYVLEDKVRLVAMSVLASGAIAPKDAADYLRKFPLASVIFGASSQQNIRNTYDLFSSF
ncbi:MAG: hypothetical protein R6V77_07650 [Candidatus Cloacimonadaceae bacterium]